MVLETQTNSENVTNIRSTPAPITPRVKRLLEDVISPMESIEDDEDDLREGDRTSILLEEENKMLRHELDQLRRQVAKLQKHIQSSPQRKRGVKNVKPVSVPGVVLELPRTLKQQSSGYTSTFCPRGNGRVVVKDHQSVSTTDEKETVEPRIAVEVHESAAGLHHRLSGHQKQIIERKRDPNDDSLSSKDESVEYEVDDDDDDVCVEAQQLIGSRTRQRSHNTERFQEESFYKSVIDRAGWLTGLLVLQSLSSFIIARNENLLEQHMVIIRFLTMLVGAGGNAGNQASVRVIRGLAVGSIDSNNTKKFLKKEFMMGVALSLIIGTAGCIRAAVFMTPFWETVAITSSLFMIVIISILLGAVMPLGMQLIGIDPAHSSTTIQVVMDILGVLITVQMSSLILDAGFREWFGDLFGSMLMIDA